MLVKIRQLNKEVSENLSRLGNIGEVERVLIFSIKNTN